MNKGYFTFAQYSKKFGDYPRMAYALALSLKASQTKGPTDLTVGMTEDDLNTSVWKSNLDFTKL